MDWRNELRDRGVPLAFSADLATVIVALVLVIGAAWIGWFAGRRTCEAITTYAHRLGGHAATFRATVMAALVRYAVLTLLLLIVGNALHIGPLAEMIIAVALGIVIFYKQNERLASIL